LEKSKQPYSIKQANIAISDLDSQEFEYFIHRNTILKDLELKENMLLSKKERDTINLLTKI